MSNVKLTRKMLGALGEQYALEHLQALNYSILAQNWRCRTGEIDLIGMDGELLIIIEVRTRSGSTTFGMPQESINALKQQKVRETAQFYTHRHQLLDRQLRFDVISVVTDREGQLLTLDHIPNAF
ncbi:MULTISPECIES: YraN family protein [unclassified Paenibacillus]|uniref:YraN family protein n=1 Tax=unclassified Paenibacillus TaxID=185978 RepID=UPI003632E881